MTSTYAYCYVYSARLLMIGSILIKHTPTALPSGKILHSVQ